MPIIMGVHDTLPNDLRCYSPMIDRCGLPHGETVYLTVYESLVLRGRTQRRSGTHTDATNSLGWGGWGAGGIWMASTDGDCAAWNLELSADDVDSHGGLVQEPAMPATKLDKNVLYQISDRTPHRSLEAKESHHRQFFRLVGPEIGGWFVRHSTANPLGIPPKAKVITESKFATP